MSLFELTQWCNERFGKHPVSSDPGARPYDVPYLVLDSRNASDLLGWEPRMTSVCILKEIADHAVAHEDWLEISAA
jgi:CDP-paratose 2-epimerase